jgi:adenylate kinase
MLNIVLFGPPGAGKGTQSEKLIEKYQLVHLSTGDILRGEIAAGTTLGLEAKSLMDAGLLVPDEVVIGMIESKLDQNAHANGFIFDGFPRTAAQASALDKLLAEKNTAISMMLALEVSDEELTKRLLLRGQNSGRADDQNEEIIRNRIREYNNKTAPLKEYYSAQNKYKAVYGIGSIDEIFAALCEVIDGPKNEVKKAVVTAAPVVKAVVKKAVAKKAAKKSSSKSTAAKTKSVKKVAEKSSKKVAKKVTKKVAVKKAAKKVAKKIVAKKAAKKSVVRKAAKKVVKKLVKKAAPKKSTKKVVKKSVKKAVAKKVAKKSSPKKVVKKASKKVVKSKKATSKKVTKKAGKKVVAKKAAKRRK